MGNLLPQFKKALIDEMIYNINSGNSAYYAFASNPIAYTGSTPNTSLDDYSSQFEFDWKLLFGKKLKNSNISYIIKNNMWVSGTVYSMYDNTDENLYTKNDFYVIAPPDYPGGNYNIYKCLNNAGGAASVYKPNLIQFTSFTTADGYKWKYLTSITYKQYTNFSTLDFSPVYSNNITSLYANLYSGVEVVVIANSGSGYTAYTDGIIQSANSTVIQIENTASPQNGIYTNSAMYIYNAISTTSQLLAITDYVSNASGKWVYVNAAANTDNILPGSTNYKISPRVIFSSDGNTKPLAYSLVDPDSTGISNIVMLDIGSDISWANVYVDSSIGSGSNLYAIVPPPGGHGFDIPSELNVKGLSIWFEFANSEISTIPTNIQYNKIGILKNPYSLLSNTAKGSAYTANTFNQLLKADLGSPVSFTVGDLVSGVTSGAVGIVAFCNTTVIHLAGDKRFTNHEYILSSDGSVTANISITSLGNVYAKDIKPIYIQNINNVNRSNSQVESFKLIIQV